MVPTLALPTHGFVVGKVIPSWVSNGCTCSRRCGMASMALNLRYNRDLNCFTVTTSYASPFTPRRPWPYHLSLISHQLWWSPLFHAIILHVHKYSISCYILIIINMLGHVRIYFMVLILYRGNFSKTGNCSPCMHIHIENKQAIVRLKETWF